MTLVEALVAILIFSVAFLTAMMLYQTANRTYLRTDAAAVQQQNVRFALDRMSETIRDAGAGHNILGSSKVADEQIEGAWESAIFVRGDFDGARETADGLESTTYPIVTTGNDEIVGYVLRKPVPADGPDPNTETLTIIADFSAPRDAVYTNQTSISNEETRTVKVAAWNLSQQGNPPYRLERVTFDAAGNARYEVVAENVFRLSFRYLEDDVTLEPITATTASGGANNERDERARVRRIEINLTGMTDRPDLGYRDETEYDPAVPEFTRGHRKFTVAQTIYSPNLGVVGGTHNATLPLDLPTPTYITACAGHCRTYLISWPPSSNPGVTTYRLEITAPADAVLGLDGYVANEDVIGTSYEFQEPMDDVVKNANRAFTFRVAAMAGPIIGNFTTAVARTSVNSTPASTPADVTNVTAAQAASGINALRVTWDPVLLNTGTVTASTCTSAGTVSGSSAPPSPWNGKAVDLKEARVYRRRFMGSNTGADVAATDEITTLEIGDLANDASVGSFLDKTAAPCSSYFYRVKACDLCDVTSDNLSAPMQDPVQFTLADGIVPAKPEKPTPVGAVTYSGGSWNVQLQWAPVTRTADDEEAAVSHYVVRRYKRLGNSANWLPEPLETQNIYEATQSHPDSAPGNENGQSASYRYTVTAMYDCATPRPSVESEPYEIGCVSLTNDINYASPAEGEVFTRPSETLVPITMSTTGTGWTSATLTVTGPDGTVYGPFTGTFGTNTVTFPPWNVADDQTYPDGLYELSVSAMVGECAIPNPEVRQIELDSVTCGQRVAGPYTWDQTTGNNAFRELTFRVENNCPFGVTFNAMRAGWSGVINGNTVTQLRVGSTIVYNNGTGAGKDVTFPVTATTLPAASGASPSVTVMTLRMSDNFTQNGSGPNQGGVPGKFSSIFINVTSPQSTTEQLLDDGTPIP